MLEANFQYNNPIVFFRSHMPAFMLGYNFLVPFGSDMR